MTKKIASPAPGSASKMGRNPFAEKPKAKPVSHLLDMLDEVTAESKAGGIGSNGWFERIAALPVKGLVLGLKSLLVVHYFVSHPNELKL